MIAAVITEFIGTFFFLSIILTSGQAIPIGIALAAAIYFGGSISGANLNPAVTAMFYAKGTISLEKCITYIIAQVVGGLLALLWYKSTVAKK